MLANWVDLIILETFGDTESLAQAVTVARAECDLPVIAQLTFDEEGRTLGGEEPRAYERTADLRYRQQGVHPFPDQTQAEKRPPGRRPPSRGRRRRCGRPS